MPDEKQCPKCGTLNLPDAMACSNCGTSLMRTLSIKMAEIDDRDPTLRVFPVEADPFTVRLTKRLITIGRDEGQDVRVTSPGIAARHARVMIDGANYRIFDITPGQGVLINGIPLDSGLLRDGDLIRLQDAKTGIGISITYSNPVERAMGTSSIGRIYKLEPLPFTLGRDPASNIKFDGLAVSWHHAKIEAAGAQHVISDMGSANGTFVNDRRVNGAVRLHPDDVIRIDKALLVYNGHGLQRLASIQQFQIDGRDLEMTYSEGLIRRQKLNTMRQVSIAIRPQEFIVVIGGSGSGKSTLLRALNGAARATGGQVTINGDDLYAHYPTYQPIIGYVPQADIVQDNLRVRQALTFGSRLRFPNEPDESRTQRVDRVLVDLELTDFQAQLVGSLSGGQKKRVSIALELMAEPGLLFMDEPTSGLDPGLDKVMMDTLRKLADRGHVILVVTHTTLHIDQCDRLAFMARGNLTYFGPPKEALTFFGARNYSEIYNRVFQSPDPTVMKSPSPSEAAREWAEHYRQTPTYMTNVIERMHAPAKTGDTGDLSNKRLAGYRRGTFMQQARVLTERTAALVRHDLRTTLALLLVLPLVGLFLALISYDNTTSARGQMLVNRGDENTLRAEVLDRLPITPVDATNPGGSPSGTQAAAGANGAVRGMATYAPASDAQRLLFMMSLAVVLLGIFSAAYTIVVEKSLFLRERMVNLRIAPYLLSKFVVYGGLALASCLLLLIAVALGVRLPDHGVLTWGPLELFITLALTAFTGVGLGLLISALTGRVDAATYAVLGVLFVQILLPGVLFKMDGVLKPFSQLTVTRWSLEALGATADMTARNAEGRIVVISDPVNPRTGQVLEGAPQAKRIFPAPATPSVDYPNDAGGLIIHWGVLIGFTLVFAGAASLALNRNESL